MIEPVGPAGARGVYNRIADREGAHGDVGLERERRRVPIRTQAAAADVSLHALRDGCDIARNRPLELHDQGAVHDAGGVAHRRRPIEDDAAVTIALRRTHIVGTGARGAAEDSETDQQAGEDAARSGHGRAGMIMMSMRPRAAATSVAAPPRPSTVIGRL
jgi:hypothetical protein